jgi:hypothetical protein
MLPLRTVLPVAALLGLMLAGSASALTPESNEVKALVKKGLDWLEKQPSEDKMGGKALAALAFLKSGREDHRIIKETAELFNSRADWSMVDNYSLGLAIIYLAELDDQKYLPQIQRLMDHFLARQKPHGGFGYNAPSGPDSPLGDISQTQYAVLAMWNAKMAGAKVPQEAIERVCNFLLRVQDPGGGWCYNGNDPGHYQRVAQQGVTNSLTAAGLGSICVCADLLGIHRRGKDQPEDTGVPEALKVVKKSVPVEAKAIVTNVDKDLVERAIQDGMKWQAMNYKIEVGAWNFYYLYAMERSESFREWYYGKPTKEPKWYSDGFAFLSQKGIAGWTGDQSPGVSTSFAILFLQRSSRKAIAKKRPDLGEGVLTSGKGLPTDLANAAVKRGKVVDSPLAGEVDDVVAMLDDPDNPELARLLENNEDFKLDPDATKRTGQIVRLRSLVSTGNWEARMVAVRGLGKARELDSVPSLLYALTDPDPRVVFEADAALRFISRKFQGVGLGEPELTEDGRPTEAYKRAIQKARAAWKTWYLSIRPDAELLD